MGSRAGVCYMCKEKCFVLAETAIPSIMILGLFKIQIVNEKFVCLFVTQGTSPRFSTARQVSFPSELPEAFEGYIGNKAT